MIRESLIFTSVTAIVDLQDTVPRGRRRKTASECDRVVSFSRTSPTWARNRSGRG